MGAMKWYVVQVYTSQEAKVVQYVQEFIDNGDLDGIIEAVMSPTQDVVQVKGGKKIKTVRKFFPGYVLVKMDAGKEALHFMRSVNGVSDFVGKNKPLPMRESEVKRILGQVDTAEETVISEVPFNVGDSVKIKEGPFKDFDGVIDEVHPEKGKVKVMVSVFGRSTPVEVDFVQVDSIS